MCGASDIVLSPLKSPRLRAPWCEGSYHDRYGSRRANEPYSPKTNLFATMDPLALMEALELGAAASNVSAVTSQPAIRGNGLRRCRLVWDGKTRCTMYEELPDGGQAFVLRASRHNDIFYITEKWEGEQNATKPADEDIEAAGAMVPMGAKEEPFRLLSRGCEQCDAQAVGGCRSITREATPGWMARLLSRGHGPSWVARQVLLEAQHTTHKLHSGAMAHMMEVQIPMIDGVDKPIWCPQVPRNPNAEDCLVLTTKLPTWNQQLGTMVLDFGGRVKKASARNFQLCAKEEEKKGKNAQVLLQYGKVKQGQYVLDYQYPLSAQQALTIALSVGAWK